jgi:hypothetical protein
VEIELLGKRSTTSGKSKMMSRRAMVGLLHVHAGVDVLARRNGGQMSSIPSISNNISTTMASGFILNYRNFI